MSESVLFDTPGARAPRLGATERVLARVLELASDQLGMDIAWVSEVGHGDYRLRAVRGDSASFDVHEGL